MAKEIQITVPVETNEGRKIVPIQASVSEGTVEVDGTHFNLVKHQGSGFKYLADSKTVDSLENSDATDAMNSLELEEGM